jgi:hypothetical protein
VARGGEGRGGGGLHSAVCVVRLPWAEALRQRASQRAAGGVSARSAMGQSVWDSTGRTGGCIVQSAVDHPTRELSYQRHLCFALPLLYMTVVSQTRC